MHLNLLTPYPVPISLSCNSHGSLASASSSSICGLVLPSVAGESRLRCLATQKFLPSVLSVQTMQLWITTACQTSVRSFVHLSIHLSPQVSAGSMIIGVHRSNSAAVPTIAGCKQDVVQLWTLLSLLLPSKRRKNVHFNFFCVNFFSHTITNLNRRSSSRR